MIWEILKIVGCVVLVLGGGLFGLFVVALMVQITSGDNPWE